MEASFLSSAEEALRHFGVTEESGLSDSQVKSSRATYGCNGRVSLPPIHKIRQPNTY